ncbi:MAG: hypothetical protein QXT02_03575 [Candidatus Hadarchaeum sp.]
MIDIIIKFLNAYKRGDGLVNHYIGAEGYGVDAIEAVAVCKKILGKE